MSEKLPKVLTDDEWDRLKDSFFSQAKPGRLPRWRTPRRNYVACRLIVATGLRASELTSLEWKHVDMDSQRLTVRDGKGGKDRRIPFGDEIAEDLRRWREEESPSPDDPVFTTKNGTAVSRRYMYDMIRRHAEKAEIAEHDRVGVHTLRHTFATRLLRACGNLRHVQKLLGHADLKTTQVYTHVVDDDLRQSIERMAV